MKNKKSKKEIIVSRQMLNRVLYLGELPSEIDQYELYHFITEKSNIVPDSMQIQKKAQSQYSFAYVKFHTRNDAEKAQETLHLAMLGDNLIRANLFSEKNCERQVLDNKGNLIIKNLSPEITPKQLCEIMQKFGKILSIKLKTGENGQSLGYGYIQFSTNEEAEKAIENLNNKSIIGRIVTLEKFVKNRVKLETEDSDNTMEKNLVFIQVLPFYFKNENDLEKYFKIFGKINFCSVIRTKSGVNHGIILFQERKNAENCVLNTNGKIIHDGDIPIQLKLAPNKEELEELSTSKKENLKQKYDKCNLIVKSLPKDVTDKDLFEYFKVFGEIASAKVATEGTFEEKIINDKVVDKEFVYRSKGFGFVCYKRADIAENAMRVINNCRNLPGKLKDKKIIVEYYNYEEKSSINENPKKKKKKEKEVDTLFQEINEEKLKRDLERRDIENKKIDFSGFSNFENTGIKYAFKSKRNKNNILIENNPINIQNSAFEKIQNTKINPIPPYQLNNPNPMAQNLFNVNNINNFNIVNNFLFAPNNFNPLINQISNRQKQPITNKFSHCQIINNRSLPVQTCFEQNNRFNNRNNFSAVSGINYKEKEILKVQNIQNAERTIVNKIQTVLAYDDENKSEKLGEILFYYLFSFIERNGLNNKQYFDDEALCGKITGIFIKSPDLNLIELFSNETLLKHTLIEIINELSSKVN